MNRRSFWKRANIGFLVSMTLLAAVVVFVAVTQLMLIPQRAEIRALTDYLNQSFEMVSVLDEETQKAFENEAAFQKEQEAIREKMQSYFVKDSDYLDEAAAAIASMLRLSVEGDRQLTDLQPDGYKIEGCTIDNDVAKIQIVYRSRISGIYRDLRMETMQEADGTLQQTHLSAICKKVDGEWKLYRLSNVYLEIDNYWQGVGVNA